MYCFIIDYLNHILRVLFYFRLDTSYLRVLFYYGLDTLHSSSIVLLQIGYITFEYCFIIDYIHYSSSIVLLHIGYVPFECCFIKTLLCSSYLFEMQVKFANCEQNMSNCRYMIPIYLIKFYFISCNVNIIRQLTDDL